MSTIKHNLLPKQKPRRNNLKVEIDLYAYATELYPSCLPSPAFLIYVCTQCTVESCVSKSRFRRKSRSARRRLPFQSDPPGIHPFRYRNACGMTLSGATAYTRPISSTYYSHACRAAFLYRMNPALASVLVGSAVMTEIRWQLSIRFRT